MEKHCADIEPHEGKVQACLAEKEDKLDWDCRAEVFRQQKENADDIRLSIRLFRACLGDKRKVGLRYLSLGMRLVISF